MRNHLPPISNVHRKQTRQLDVPLRTLLGTGPSNVPTRVLQALSTQVIGQHDTAFLTLQSEVQDLLRYIWQTDNEYTFAVAGGEQGALEAAIASVLQPGDMLLVGDSGQLSERIVHVAEAYGVNVQRIARRGDVIVLDDIRVALESHRPAMLALVHGELSTGALQPLDGVGDLCHQHGALLMVDTIGSLGAVPVYVDAWSIDVCYSVVDKCLSAVPGLSLLTIGPRTLEKVNGRSNNRPAFAHCLHIERLAHLWGSNGRVDDLLPVNLLYALRESLRMMADEGLIECWQRHRNNAELLWFGLEDLNLVCPVALEHRLPSLTSVRIPERINSKAVKQHLLTHYNIEVAVSPDEVSIWRIGLMGYNSRAENVTLLLRSLEDALRIVR